MAIDIYTTRTMMDAISSAKPVRTFLKDTFFASKKTHVTETVDVEYRKGRRKMAPFVSPRKPGVPEDRLGYTTKTFKAPLIKPSTIITGEEINKKSFGENLYSNTTPAQRAAKMLAEDLRDLDEQITRREEWMVAQVMFTGQVAMTGDGVDQILDFDFTNRQTLSGTSLWSDKQNSDPIGDLKRWRLSILQKSGISPDIVIMSQDVASHFINHPGVKDAMDIKRIMLGKIEPQLLPNGVTFMGTITMLGLDIYTYDEWYFDEADQQEKPLVPTGKILIASTNARSAMTYGAVTVMINNNFTTIEGTRAPVSWTKNDPPARYVQVNARPLPIPHEVDSWYVAQVI